MTARDELAKIIADHGPPEYLSNRHALWKWIEDNDEAVLALIDAVDGYFASAQGRPLSENRNRMRAAMRRLDPDWEEVPA